MEEMKIKSGLSSSAGLVPGPYRQEIMVCQYSDLANSQGSIWFGGEPFAYSGPVLFAQFTLIFLVSRFIFFFIKPFRQSQMSAQIITGIIMGPSFLAKNKEYAKKILPPGGRLILSTVADIGFMLHLFLLGVQVDLDMLRNVRRNALIIGTSGFTLAILLGGLAVITLPQIVEMDDKTLKSLPIIVTVNSISSFAVITSLLTDLNMLNSEMGRLATFVSMVCDLWSYFFSTAVAKIGVAVRLAQWEMLWSVFWIAVYVFTILFVLRPLIRMIGKRIPEGKTMKESHFVTILMIVFGCAFCAEVIGQHCGIGSFLIGMVVPDGPPLGETLVNKLDAISTGFLLPAKFVITGLHVNLSSIKRSSAAIVEVVILSGYIGKFLGTFCTALYCSVPLVDAVSLSLVMCCKGIVDIGVYSIMNDEGILGNQEHALMIITMLIVTGLARTLVGQLYDPSRRYMVHNRSNIQDSRRHNVDLRMLVCIHKQDNVPTIINLLEASNPTKDSPISVVVLTLMELKGRAASILVPNSRKGKLTSTVKHSKPIVNAFSYYAQADLGRVFLQHFTAVAPYSSMHDDICMLALDTSATIVIVPFHKQWTVDGKVGAVFPSIRNLNLNVMKKAPCSVGVLVDRSQVSGSQSGFSSGLCLLRVALLFLGGADDREALAYGSRMADHPSVTLTTVWIRPSTRNKLIRHEMEDDLDVDLMNEFRANAMGKKGVVFKEEKVEDAEGATRVIHSMEDRFDMFIVGRHHEPDSPLLLGLNEWSDCPELGVIGDMLASSDFRFSVLVVQQQPRGTGFLDTNLIAPIGSSSRSVGSGVYHDPPDTEELSLRPIRTEYKERVQL